MDALAVLKLRYYKLSTVWIYDLLREILADNGLEHMADEILPFTVEHSHTNLVTIIDDEDIKDTRFWSNETLTERYQKAKEELV